MCIFQSGKDIPTLVRISLRTLQYLIIPLMSMAILVVGSMHLGKCAAQPLLPIWHVVAGASGLLTPIFYLLFDEINPQLSQRLPGVSSFIDNVVVLLLPIYILFEISWLITGTVWVVGSEGVEDPEKCDHTVYIFSFVVVVNFWIHILTPLVFMLALCCTRIFPYCAHCGYWNILKTAIDHWTRRTRLGIAFAVAWPLAIAMVIAGAFSVKDCQSISNTTTYVTTPSYPKEFSTVGQQQHVIVSSDTKLDDRTTASLNDISLPYPTKPSQAELLSSTLSTSFISSGLALNDGDDESMSYLDKIRIPVWLIVAGIMVLFVPCIYYVYDKYCKDEGGGPFIKSVANCLVILYLLCGLTWAVVGFVWVFGSHQHVTCGADSFTYQFAFGTLIILNCIMDIWICFKICVVLYWAFLSEE